MMPHDYNLYTDAHLFVAAIRILSHKEKAPPALDHVCRYLAMSVERGGIILRRLIKEEIVESVEQPHGDRLFVNNHLNIEKFKHAPTPNELDKALAEFKSEKQTFTQKIESIKADQAQKQKDLFAKIESQLKKEADSNQS